MQLRAMGILLLVAVLPACAELGNSELVAVDSVHIDQGNTDQGNMTNKNSELVEVDSGEIICKSFTARTPDGMRITITRKKSWGNILKLVAKILAVAALIAAIIVGSIYTAGLFKAFMAASDPVELFNTVVRNGVIQSQKSMGMWYSQSAIAAYSVKVMMLAGTTGIAAGALAQTAAAQMNLDFGSMTSNQKIQSEMQWLTKFDDVCAATYIDVAYPDGTPVDGPWKDFGVEGKLGLAGLEETSDKKAHDALVKYCMFYGKHNLFGQGNTMPVPDMCKKIYDKLKPADHTCGAEGETTELPQGDELLDESFTCAAMLEVSRDEMTFQDAYMNVGVMGDMKKKEKAGAKCSAGAATNLGFKSSSERLLCEAEGNKVDFCKDGGLTPEDFTQELADLEVLKANAIFDCLSLTSCNLLRKDSDKIQGVVRSRKTFGMKTQKHTDMLSMVVKRCLGHPQLLGTKAQTACVETKDCEEDLAEDTDMFMVHSDVVKDDTFVPTDDNWHDTLSDTCDADDASVWDEDEEHCSCIEGSHYVADDDKCVCNEPAEATMKEAVLLTKNEAGEDEKKCVKRCQAGFIEIPAEVGSVCLTPFIVKAVQVGIDSLQQGTCDPAQLEVTTKAGKPFCLDNYLIEYIMNMGS